jgi:hypothetical protein
VFEHGCSTCDPGPLQVVDHQRGVVRVPTRFRGPPTSANGGVAAGLYACLGEVALGAPCLRLQVRLHRPPPLETDLPYEFTPNAEHPGRIDVRVLDRSANLVLSGWVSAERDPVMPESTVSALAALSTPDQHQRHRFDTHVETPNPNSESFNSCFVCGPEAEGGLRLRPRPVTDDIRWLPWQPHSDWADRDGLGLLTAIAALDCTSAIGLAEEGLTAPGEACLLGTYDADILERPTGTDADELRIVTSARGREGRKIWTDVGLFTPDGRPMILGLATWIVVAPEIAAGAS